MDYAISSTTISATRPATRRSYRSHITRFMNWISDTSYDPHRFRNEIGESTKFMLIQGHVVSVAPHLRELTAEDFSR
jgi:hypothetical protein